MNLIIDTGCANLSSVKFALERLGAKVIVSADKQQILSADKVFLPGVGTASEAMNNLRQRGLIEVVKAVESPLLGICLGMQMLCEYSIEGGAKVAEKPVPCLGLIPGTVAPLTPQVSQRLPHMGWNQVKASAGNPLFKGIEEQHYFYFVHSYALAVGESTIAECDYGQHFSAAVNYKNFYGVQFHPERSGQAGAKLLQNFLDL
ncbi:imidazole glycerol phosphate synthase subunit HisH [Alginatibacterium sediminis]|uniref:Imidazole glycerol phosphate synthase subunit HisH n=1 Tax=Alginatibacterium sediminis TaxID=2164068 RepID=A0A420EFW7_9ALTE|nr:imidazole glycerol phosphate synthase subunit HisH [Alginatibacterium sediminis]RKF19568.1 imidazole glycerol phosphate synthase subunit HisH [Alginatibacterium sediminis]